VGYRQKSPSAKSEQYWECSVYQLICAASTVFAVQLGIVMKENQIVAKTTSKFSTPTKST